MKVIDSNLERDASAFRSNPKIAHGSLVRKPKCKSTISPREVILLNQTC